MHMILVHYTLFGVVHDHTYYVDGQMIVRRNIHD